jgi:serine/threonine protein kinase
MGFLEDPPQLVLEYAEHGSLRHVLDDEATFPSLSWELRLSFARDVAKGMRYLHETMARIHRDLKSDNLLVTEAMQVKITDFDKARRFYPDGMELPTMDVTQSSEVETTQFSTGRSSTAVMTSAVGTREWTAVELLRSSSRYVRYGKAIDVYSYGVVLWEVATRQIPYHDLQLKDMTLLRKITTEQLRPTVSADIPPQWVDLMQDCWQDDAGLRPTFASICASRFDSL